MSHDFNFQPTAMLVLETGESFPGLYVGKSQRVTGILCFNTSMTGYQETLSDPSYAGQILVFTFPHIGNVGTNAQDQEALQPHLQAVVLGDQITLPSNYRSESSLSSWFKKYEIPTIVGVDTRALVHTIRNYGKPLKAAIVPYENQGQDLQSSQHNAKEALTLDNDYTQVVSTKTPYVWEGGRPYAKANKKESFPQNYKLVLVDYGAKANIMRILVSLDCTIQVVPPTMSFSDIQKYNPDGIILSNGPGDPCSVSSIIHENIKTLIVSDYPILGICFGYQLLALAYQAHVVKMSCGHHGINHPVLEIDTGKILITSQNHEFAVDETTLPASLIPTYRSLFDGSLEGFKVFNKPITAVQFHPEACPGPLDANYILEDFIGDVIRNAQAH